MIEKPKISDQKIIACLQEAYGLNVSILEFLNLGHVNTASYRVTTVEHIRYFLKLKKDGFNEISVTVPMFLKNEGLNQILAPLITRQKKLWSELDEFKLILFPFIEGRNGFEITLSEKEWTTFGQALKKLHQVKLPQNLTRTIPKETFSSKWRDIVKVFLERIENEAFNDHSSYKLATFIKAKKQQINFMVNKSQEYATLLRKENLTYVLCHSDIHANNILIDISGNLYIIDWDDIIFAPKERDLMFIGGGIGGVWNKKDEVEMFYKGYGKSEINSLALKYYRYGRIVQDIAEYCKSILITENSTIDKERMVERFIKAFSANNVVDIAMSEKAF